MAEITITVPCNVGDDFWIIAYSHREVIKVRCTGYGIYKDDTVGKDESYIWVNRVCKWNDYWKIPFIEFETQCFKTKEEAEKHL